MRLSNQLMRVILPLAVTAPLAAFAADDTIWNCQNLDFEISCTDGACAAADAHTPMDIQVSHDEISWCAYSGCWAGATSATVASGRFQTYHGLAMENAADPSYIVDVAIMIDTVSHAASIMAADLFTTPAICTPEG